MIEIKWLKNIARRVKENLPVTSAQIETEPERLSDTQVSRAAGQGDATATGVIAQNEKTRRSEPPPLEGFGLRK